RRARRQEQERRCRAVVASHPPSGRGDASNEKAARNRKVANRHLNNQVWECTKSNLQPGWRSGAAGDAL
ncbi:MULTISPECIES: hypothetical protein, partial [Xanthomonas]|uniref:hypothetical protein n=1 Tax=Xanthomonas TaxID=338 RepID=UPI001C62DAD6